MPGLIFRNKTVYYWSSTKAMRNRTAKLVLINLGRRSKVLRGLRRLVIGLEVTYSGVLFLNKTSPIQTLTCPHIVMIVSEGLLVRLRKNISVRRAFIHALFYNIVAYKTLSFFQ